MKRILALVMLLFCGVLAMAQDTQPKDTIWWVNGQFGFTLNQVSLTNWAAGGQNSVAFGSTFGLDVNYKQDKWKWDNLIRLGYGLVKQGEEPINKTDDQILINSSLGYELKGPWYAVLNVNFRTQFTNGYNLPNDSVKISTFMAPGYLVAGIGVEYKPNDNLAFMITPITAKSVFVLDDVLAQQGAFGVDSSANSKTELGAFISFAYKKEIIKNVTLGTLYTMFGNYENLASWDINWDLVIDFKINEWLGANITTNLIYDEDIAIPVDSNDDGDNDSFGPRVQFRQAFGIGIAAKF